MIFWSIRLNGPCSLLHMVWFCLSFTLMRTRPTLILAIFLEKKRNLVMTSFAEALREFDEQFGNLSIFPRSLTPVHGRYKEDISIQGGDGKKLEEYYKWQFVYALIYSGLYIKDYLGIEVHFPKGSTASAALKLDGAIFDSPDWLQHYNDYWSWGRNRNEDLQWLNDHLLGVIEFKRNEQDIEQIFTRQVKPAMREKDPSDAYVIGIYYDAKRLFLFHRRNGKYLRYDEAKNQKSDLSQVSDLSLHLPDPYTFIPSFDELVHRVHRPTNIDRSKRNISDLDIISSIGTVQMTTALSSVLRKLDELGLVNQKGYEILIQTLALKIFDERRNQKSARPLEFYITDRERNFENLNDIYIQDFRKRMEHIYEDAAVQYRRILKDRAIEWRRQEHVQAVIAVCENFQDFSFVRSSKSDLYQLVFYNFANKFQQQEKAQFLTPLDIIDFIVKVVNPRRDETVFDPCCGIADFLSLSFIHSQTKSDPWKLDDANIYGADISSDMITLASLNMLLNGDGEARLFTVKDKGSILWKIKRENPPEIIKLLPDRHRNGNWDDWPDETQLMKFDVILTNPPFGEDRAYRTHTSVDRKIIEMYETWNIARTSLDAEDAFDAQHKRGKEGKTNIKSIEAIDQGIIFLENAYRCLKFGGRLGIVLSNSIASISKWQKVREWVMNRMRIVALFDLPPNIFAETGVNTTIIIAYKPSEEELKRLNEQRYSVFVRDIQHVGYENRTSKRNVFFNKLYRIDEQTFEIMTDDNGNPVLDEDFTQTLRDFQYWAKGQEETLQRLFIRED